MAKAILIILFSQAWSTVGHILYKKATNSLEVYSLRGISGHIKFIKEVMVKPIIWLGLASMGISLAAWFVALAGADLSVIAPFGSMQYILILIAARIFLGEKINKLRLAGTFLIVLGIILVAMS